ncbi:MAG: hypothetical protein V1804_00575 [Patescibacteria group bacterium]
MQRYFEKDLEFLKQPSSWQSKMGIKIAKAGVIPIPLSLFRFKRDLGLKYSDAVFIGFAFMYKQGDSLPYFSLAKLNRDFGIPQDTSNRIVRRLREKGYLITIPRSENARGKGRNSYDFSELIKTLEKLIDINKDKIFKSDKWSVNDYLDYAFIKGSEKEAKSENRSEETVEIGDDNKYLNKK